MATQHSDTRLADLKARMAALGCELLEDETEGADKYYVLDKRLGKLVSVGQSLDDTYDWVELQEKDRVDAAKALRPILFGDYPLPTSLVAARDLYVELVREGDSLTEDRIAEYLRGTEAGIAGGRGSDSFIWVEGNLTRIGVSFAYAARRLKHIVLGSEELPVGMRNAANGPRVADEDSAKVSDEQTDTAPTPPEEPKEAVDIVDRLHERLRYARSVCDQLTSNEHIEEVDKDSIALVEELIESAKSYSDELWKRARAAGAK